MVGRADLVISYMTMHAFYNIAQIHGLVFLVLGPVLARAQGSDVVAAVGISVVICTYFELLNVATGSRGNWRHRRYADILSCLQKYTVAATLLGGLVIALFTGAKFGGTQACFAASIALAVALYTSLRWSKNAFYKNFFGAVIGGWLLPITAANVPAQSELSQAVMTRALWFSILIGVQDFKDLREDRQDEHRMTFALKTVDVLGPRKARRAWSIGIVAVGSARIVFCCLRADSAIDSLDLGAAMLHFGAAFALTSYSDELAWAGVVLGYALEFGAALGATIRGSTPRP